MDTFTFRRFCIEQHDVVCNQKYDNKLPYSFHLNMVYEQAQYFMPLCGITKDVALYSITRGCFGHDLIEDARITYNDILQRTDHETADIIYLCTENKGKNRLERKNDAFYEDLKQNDIAVFVKLCDIAANSLYSLSTRSTMFEKQKSEWPRIKTHLLRDQFRPIFDFLDKIYTL